MNKQEIFDNIKDFLKDGKLVTNVYPKILEKHGATDITSGFADKLDTVADPFERFLVAMHAIDQMNPEQQDEAAALRDRHGDLLMTCLKLNRPGAVTEIHKLREFDRYISKFEIVE